MRIVNNEAGMGRTLSEYDHHKYEEEYPMWIAKSDHDYELQQAIDQRLDESNTLY